MSMPNEAQQHIQQQQQQQQHQQQFQPQKQQIQPIPDANIEQPDGGGGGGGNKWINKFRRIFRRGAKQEETNELVTPEVGFHARHYEYMYEDEVPEHLKGNIVRDQPAAAPSPSPAPAPPVSPAVDSAPIPTQEDAKKKKEPKQAQRVLRDLKKLEEQQYYHGYIDQGECEKLLLQDGDFLVRTIIGDDHKEQQVLSVYHNNKVYNSILKRTSDEQHHVYVKKYKFETIEFLIHWYRHNGHPLIPGRNLRIIAPKEREKWELFHSQVVLGKRLGKGNFGEVFMGKLSLPDRRTPVNVAVKRLSVTQMTRERVDDVLREARFMREYQHRNLVRFYGICAHKTPVMIVMELVSGGALEDVLAKNKHKLTLLYLTKYCADAGRGLAYLHSKNAMHQDIAARNCLLDKQNQIVKIADFGLSGVVQDKDATGAVKRPVRWTALELLCKRDQPYTLECDVWSFGILMWEVYTKMEYRFPYPQFMTNPEVRAFLLNGNRLTPPDNAQPTVQQCMLRCWAQNPKDRPTMHQVVEVLKKADCAEPTPTQTE